MKRLLFIILFFACSIVNAESCGAECDTFYDDFNRSNGALGYPWETVSGFNGMVIISNTVRTSVNPGMSLYDTLLTENQGVSLCCPQAVVGSGLSYISIYAGISADGLSYYEYRMANCYYCGYPYHYMHFLRIVSGGVQVYVDSVGLNLDAGGRASLILDGDSVFCNYSAAYPSIPETRRLTAYYPRLPETGNAGVGGSADAYVIGDNFYCFSLDILEETLIDIQCDTLIY